MKGYIENIETLTLSNDNFRKVLYTDDRLQLVVMSLLPNEDIGEEVHNLDQFIRVEQGSGVAILNGVETHIGDGSVVIIPTGTRHNILNSSATEKMKLYTLYSPPNHRDGVVHATKAEAEKDEEHFDGQTTE
jgi:mannose-6-phosphate isomerase-like protein (cupin superfamily)